jgi:copper(I)-binding protein
MSSIRAALLLLITGLAAFPALAQVAVANAWVRGTVAGQKATGAFMELKSPADTALVAVASPSPPSSRSTR